MKIGYARVATDDQSPALQLDALKKAGCSKIYRADGISGASSQRPALLRCLRTLKGGDTLTVWKLDRLGRSLRDLITMLDDLRDRGIKFSSLTEAIDTTTPTGRAMWQLIEIDMLVQVKWQGRKMAALFPNWPPLIRTNQQRKPSATGITGFHKVISSERTGFTQPC